MKGELGTSFLKHWMLMVSSLVPLQGGACTKKA